MIEQGTLLQERYRVLRLVSKGGMGAVYEATDERLDTSLALKECFFDQPQLLRQFEREARLLARLRHQALTRVFDHFTENGVAFLVMEFIPGEDLGEMMKKGERFSPQRVVKWADQLLDALEFLHGQQIPVIHRDIKPQNLKLTSRDEIILLDFGLAKGHAGQTTQVSTFGYTPNYAPLEQMQGTEGTDAQSDLYSLAATIYHLLTGMPPPGPLARVGKITDRLPDPLVPPEQLNPDIPSAVGAVILKAMSLGRDGRHKTAGELRSALRDAMAGNVPPPQFSLGTAAVPRPPDVFPAAATEPKTIASTASAPASPATASPAATTEIAPAGPRKKGPWLACILFFLAVFLALGVGTCWYVRSKIRGTGATVANPPTTSTVITSSEQVVAPAPVAPNAPQDADAPIFTMTGHTTSVKAVHFSPDGKLLASASWDGTARVWSVPDGKSLLVIPRDGVSVSAVAFSPDGKTLAVGGYDSSGTKITFHDPRSGATVQEPFIDRSNLIGSLVYSADGGRLYATIGSIVRGWDLATRKEVITIEGNVNASMALSQDGQTVAVGSTNDRSFRTFSTQNGKQIREYSEHSEGILSLAYASNGFTFASGGYDSYARVWNSVTGSMVRGIPQPDLEVPFSLAFSPDATILATGSYHYLRLWEPGSGVPIRKFPLDPAGIAYDIAFSPDGSLVAAGCGSGQVVVFRVK